MEDEIQKELLSLTGLNLKVEVLSEWISTMQTLPNFDFQNKKIVLKAVVKFFLQKAVSLNAISEKIDIIWTPLNNDFQVSIFFYLVYYLWKVFRLDKQKIFEILDAENISENYESRSIDSDRRTLKLKITDGFLIFHAYEEQKLNLSKIFNKYRTSINGKLQPFDLNNLKNFKILLKEGTIVRREIFLMRTSNAIFLEEFEDFEKNGNNIQIPQPVNQNQNSENIDAIEEEALMEEFNEYMDDS